MPYLPTIVALVLTSVLQQQPVAHPSLSGHWVQVEQRTPISGSVPICPLACTLEQTAEALVVKDGMHESSYKLNGVPSTLLGTAPTLKFTMTRAAKWEGDSLVIAETIQSESLNGGRPFTTTSRLSIAEGRLTIEGVRGNNDGTENKYSVVYARKDK